MNTKTSENVTAAGGDEKKLQPPQDHEPKCPRCASGNTKFCYYNNYSMSQPRYFCKSCRRYWTKGGTLRNVPIGGGSRKNKKSAKRSYEHFMLHTQEENNHMLINSLSNYQSHSNNSLSTFSSPLSYEESPGLWFGFEPQSFIQAPPVFRNPIMANDFCQKSTNVENLSNFYENPVTSLTSTSSLYNSRLFENHGHSQPLVPYEDHLSTSFDMISGGAVLKQEMCPNNINGGLSLDNDYNNINNNLVYGSSSYNSSTGNDYA